MSRNNEEVELTLTLHYETEKAILVSEDDKKKVWLPLSQIEVERKMGSQGHDVVIVTMPLWLAEKSKFAGY